MLKKILNPEQKKEIDLYKNTFLDSVFLNPREMAILASPVRFPKANRPRLNKALADRTEEIFKELSFLFEHLPASYKVKIMSSMAFNDFVEISLNLDTMTENLDDNTRNVVIRAASQLFVNSYAAIKGALPDDFKKPMVDTATPFLRWLQAISKYGQRKSLTDVPEIHIPNKAFSPFG